jgi:hypothetical protein
MDTRSDASRAHAPAGGTSGGETAERDPRSDASRAHAPADGTSGGVLQQLVRIRTGSHVAAAMALSTTRRHATAMATMRCGQGAARAMGAHAATVEALSTRRHATAMAEMDFGLSCEQRVSSQI